MRNIFQTGAVLAIALLFAAPPPCFARSRSCTPTPTAISKVEILKVVERTEKKPVHSIEITAPGVAVVSFDDKKSVRVIFVHDCPPVPVVGPIEGEDLRLNPTGFRITEYAPIRK